jgi:Bacterial Ig-like domain
MTRREARRGVCVIACLFLPAVCCPAAGAAVYDIPADIPGEDCSVAVEDEIMAWLATVPDGNTARFAPGGCYGQEGTIALTGRSNLVIDGQGSEFRAVTPGESHRANWRFSGGSNLTVQNLAVRGSNPGGGYRAGFEWQHGFSVEGVQGMTLSNVQARETWGDGVYLDRGAYSPACGDDASSTRHALVTGATLERIGRQGVAVVDAEHVTVQDSVIGPVALANVDIETDDDCAIARHITVTRNQFGAHTWGVVDSVGFGAEPQVGDVTVTDNSQSVAAPGCFAPVRILSPVVPEGQPRVYRSGYRFSGNRLLGTRNGFELRGLRNVQVSSNDVALPPTTGCGKRAGVLLVDSHAVNIASNGFIGANNIFKANALSTGTTAEGNWTVDTSIESGPEGSVSATSASFSFGSTGVAAGFECSLDGAAFEACSSPKGYAQLADGPHDFRVRAVDAAGNPDPTPAGRSWTVDTVAPLVTLAQPAPGSTTGDDSPALAGTAGIQPGDSSTVTVKIWPGTSTDTSPLQTNTASRDPVTGAYSLRATALANGTYTARAEQSDAAGNIGPSSPSTFTVDATAPDTAALGPGRTSGLFATALLAPEPDVTPPAVELGGQRSQEARKTITVTLKASNESVWATATGKLAIRGWKRIYRLKGVEAMFVARGHRATLKLEMSSNALGAIKRALQRSRTVRAKVKLSLRDAAGNIAIRTRRITLAR